YSIIKVPGTRFELVHPYECHPLKMVRLPISPPRLIKKVSIVSNYTHLFLLIDVPEERLELSRDNSQRLLRPQRLPISPSGQAMGCKYTRISMPVKINIKLIFS